MEHYEEVVLFQRQNCIVTMLVGAPESLLYSEVSIIQCPYHVVSKADIISYCCVLAGEGAIGLGEPAIV